ncbi:hypothetical protein G7Y89_g12899 [Cudoniella acicularis]|uniref:CENP-V/GFA domain-containing protein n=1 Tax=Cudoniella acicularis TaxID=354080 RepID=A0A8H4RAX8_9HELO|nr:hypothetical protein G7Y89_g12899 [Cudoniella acicularis]
MEVYVLDNYYLAITLLITIGYQLFFFAIAFSLKFDKLTDFAGGTNFVVLAIITLAFSGHHNGRQIAASLFIMVWGVRLSGFLLFRIIKTGKDDRFDDKRDKFFPFLGFWIFQMIWVWTVSLPVTVLNSPNVTQYPQPAFGTGRDIGGIVLFAIGIIMESVSDVQRYIFKSRQSDKSAICDKGFFNSDQPHFPCIEPIHSIGPTRLFIAFHSVFKVLSRKSSHTSLKLIKEDIQDNMDVSCQCGAITFKTPLPKPLAIYICHCDECRRQSSSAFGCSAIFPSFKLPNKDLMSVYSRPTASGHTLNCFFCKTCGTRLIHSTPGKDIVSVKGGCIEGLDWKQARHIWCKRAMVPIPEGVERDEEEPDEVGLGADIVITGSGGGRDDEKRRLEKKEKESKGKGKEPARISEMDREPTQPRRKLSAFGKLKIRGHDSETDLRG